MTKEFWERLEEEFPNNEYFLRRSNYEQFNVTRKRRYERGLTPDEIKQVAEDAFGNEIEGIGLVSDEGNIQGVGPGDIIIQPRRVKNETHFIRVSGDNNVFFSITWHGCYFITPQQMNRYVGFAKRYFEALYPEDDPQLSFDFMQ